MDCANVIEKGYSVAIFIFTGIALYYRIDGICDNAQEPKGNLLV